MRACDQSELSVRSFVVSTIASSFSFLYPYCVSNLFDRGLLIRSKALLGSCLGERRYINIYYDYDNVRNVTRLSIHTIIYC